MSSVFTKIYNEMESKYNGIERQKDKVRERQLKKKRRSHT